MSGFDYFTIIGKDQGLFKAHIDNVLRNAYVPRDLWDFHAIIYRNGRIPKETTDELVSICEANDIKVTFYDEWHNNFLLNLYACWNLGQELGNRPYTIRAGSDQFFSPGTFWNMYKAHVDFEEETGQDLVTQMHTVESTLSPQSRHFIGDFGHTWDTFKEKEFNDFAASKSLRGLYTIEQALGIWGKPTSFFSSLGHINRTDGCSWMMSKKLWKRFGPMEPMRNGHTGDVTLHDDIMRAGIPNRLVGDAWTYHLVRGESR